MASTPEPTTLDRATLCGPIRAALGSDTAQVLTWQHDTLAGSGDPKTGGVYRVRGSAITHGETLSWSLILKVIRPGAGASAPTHPNYWKREVLAYRSGHLTALPDVVAAPRCYGVTDAADESAWLWLEDVTDTCGPHWALSCYETAAYCLGRFNGRTWAEPTLLAAPWLSHNFLGGSWLAQWPTDMVASFPRLLEHPLVQQVCPGPAAARLQQVLDDQALFLAALERLPQIFCHHDAWRRNLLLRRTPDGHEQAVLLDWADAGAGALGQELAAFVWAPVAYFDLEVAAIQNLEALAWAAYLEGLRKEGWRGDDAAVRLGYLADVALRSVSTVAVCTWLPEEGTRQRLEAYMGHPVEEIVPTWARLLSFLLDRADDARRLLRAL